jgi:hypothetical protein
MREKVDRRRIVGYIRTLIFSTKDFRIDIRSVKEEGGGLKVGRERGGLLGAPLVTL